MKRLIASDLHGSAVFCRQLLALYRETGAQQLVLLGDLAYSGSYDPRYEYDPQNVIDQLNAIAPDILWVEGNCDYGVGALRPRFPGSPKYLLQEWEGCTVFLTHGHRYGPQNPPPRGMAEILLSGHTHVPAWGRVEHFNSRPREGANCKTVQNRAVYLVSLLKFGRISAILPYILSATRAKKRETPKIIGFLLRRPTGRSCTEQVGAGGVR